MKATNGILSAVLLASIAIGGYILLTDSYLWSTAPTHAYGLVAFTAIDLGSVVGLWMRPRLAIAAALLISLTQLGAMSGDVFFGTLTFNSNVTTAAAFSKYLLGNTAFVALLGVQVALIAAGIAAFVTWHRALTPTSGVSKS